MKWAEEPVKNESDPRGVTSLDIHGDEITDDAEYNELYINKVHSANTNGIGTAGMEQQINMLPVQDTNNPLYIILEYNKNSDDCMIKVPISSPIVPKAIIIKDDNNNENDNKDNDGNIPGVQDNIGNTVVYNVDEVSENDDNIQTPWKNLKWQEWMLKFQERHES